MCARPGRSQPWRKHERMSDIFREVDEDLRREQYKRIWKQYGNYIIAAAVLIVVAVAGYRGWEYYQAQRAASTGDRFLAALELADAGRTQEASAALTAIANDGAGQYPVLARMRAAALKATGGDPTGAAGDFDRIAADGSVPLPLRTVARLRAAMLLVDTAPLEDIRQRVGQLADTAGAYQNAAREILGLSAFRAGNLDEARRYFEAIRDDQVAAQSISQRAQLMLDLIRSRQGTDPKADGEG